MPETQSNPSRTNNTSKSKFTKSEDTALKQLVQKYGHDDWELISNSLGTKNSRQCHDRWFYILSPKLNKTPFTIEEDNLLLYLLNKLGPRWVQISKYFSGRTDTQIKNRYKVITRRIANDYPIYIKDIPVHEAKPPTKKKQTPKITAATSSSNIDQLYAAFDSNIDAAYLDIADDLFSLFE